MSEQLSMFNSYPTLHRRSRRSDPVTSHEAAERNAKGLNRQRLEVLSWIRLYPGSTACELAQRIAIDPEHYVRLRYAISRRAPELRAPGYVRSGAPRICTISGSRQMTWYPL